ncbi:SCO7613 C-terminal domain-containing membrane protein [Actinospongicola halichondriae]|uniref:SCO7613 C-terminal domain-containing membrane protein n=1 Tax=Actinospongicola halichondriae TaxID=3236844 RepID=UPI003D4533FF
MPRTLTFPSPSTHVCPVCDRVLTGIPCPACGADLGRPEGTELFRVDGELHRLSIERGDLVRVLLQPAPATGEPVPPPPPRVVAPLPPSLPVSARSDGATPDASRWTVAEILVGLGGLSLIAAVVVFAAVAWSDLAAWAQGALLVGATGAVLGTAVACSGRGLRATGESLGAVATTLALADVEVARSALDGVVSVRSVWSIGLAVVATSALVAGRRFGLRGMSTAGAAIAFIPAPLFAEGLHHDLAAAWVLGAQAVLAVAISTIPARQGDDVSLERSIVVTGSIVSWGLAAVLGLADAVRPLVDLGRAPVAACVLLGTLAAGSVGVGRARRVQPLAAAGSALAFVPAVLFVAGAGAASGIAAVLVGQTVAGVAGAAVIRGRRSPNARASLDQVLDAGAVVSAFGAAGVAVLLSVGSWWPDGGSVSHAAVATFLALAAVAIGGARFAGWSRAATSLVLVGGVLAVLIAGALARSTANDDVITTTVALTGGVVALLAASLVRLDPERPWMAAMGAAAVSVGVLGMVPLAASGVAAVALAEVVAESEHAGAGATFADHLADAPSIVAGDLPMPMTMAQLLAVAALGVGGIVLGRRWGVWLTAAVGTSAVLVGPVAFGASIGVAVLAYLVVVAALGWRLVARPDELISVLALALVVPVSIGAATASAPLIVVATVLVAGVLVVLTQRALRMQSSGAAMWVAATSLTGLAGLTIDVIRLGSSGDTPMLVAAIAAALASATGPAIERWYPEDETGAALCADVVTGAALVLAVLASPSLDQASALVGLVGLVAGFHALREGRRHLLGVAVGAVVVVTWMRLVIAAVALLEAYTLPLAGAFLLGGSVVGSGTRSSWVRSGAGLFAALVPTTVLALAGDDLARTVVVVAASAMVVLWGAMAREQAPLAIGGVVLGVVALRHLGPVADQLPRYVVFAVAGIGLLATGATFEKRRGDLRRARDAFGQLD